MITSVAEPENATARHGFFATELGIGTFGYRVLVLLAFVLPFDMERVPLLWTGYLTVTNLTVGLLLVAAAALVSLLLSLTNAFRGSDRAVKYFSHRRIPLLLLGAFLLSCAISSIMAHASAQGGSWFLGVALGVLFWLATPLWLAPGGEARIYRLGLAFVAGAVMAGAIGLLEVAIGPAFDQHLQVFKFGPSSMGPWLRLSATFSSANVAAMYLELALPCAVAGCMVSLSRGAWSRVRVAAWLAAIDLLLVTMLLTYSRGALLGVGAAGVAMILAGRGRWMRRRAVSWRAIALTVVQSAVLLGLFIWASPSAVLLRFSTQNDRTWYQAGYTGTVPATLPAGATRVIPVTIRNRSPLTWTGSSPHTYGIGYHWLYRSGQVERFTSPITWLTSDVPPGARQVARVRVTTPPVPGAYLFIWDMNWKGTTWFSPRTGAYQTSTVRVTAPSGTTSGSIGHMTTPDIASLPTATALDRRQIWRAALTLIARHPLFGLGAQGVRMNYPAVAPADQTSKPPPHAHNLALEMVADWGIIGGGLFGAALIALWWPILRGVARGDVTEPWQLAVVGMAAALIGHELVDYFLTKQSIFALLWIVSGLATMTQWSAAGRSQPARDRKEGARPVDRAPSQ